jgi:hypothetical protein
VEIRVANKTNKQMLEELQGTLDGIASNTPEEKFKLLRGDIAWIKEAVEKLHRRLYNPDDGVVVKVNKNTEFRRDLEKQREQGKGAFSDRSSDVKQLITWKSSINRAMWIAYSLLLGLMLKLLFNIGF